MAGSDHSSQSISKASSISTQTFFFSKLLLKVLSMPLPNQKPPPNKHPIKKPKWDTVCMLSSQHLSKVQKLLTSGHQINKEDSKLQVKRKPPPFYIPLWQLALTHQHCLFVSCQEHTSSLALPSFQQEGVEQAPSLMANPSRNAICTLLLMFNQRIAFQTKVQCLKARTCCHFCFSKYFLIKERNKVKRIL